MKAARKKIRQLMPPRKGERKCVVCGGSGRGNYNQPRARFDPCPGCNGTGKMRK